MDNFDFLSSGAMTSPYLSAPSSPKRFGEYYLSAPTSPSRISQLYSEFEYFSSIDDDNDSIPSSTIQPPTNDDDGGFAFFVTRESDKPSRSAEELFDGGKIKPLKAEGDEIENRTKQSVLQENRGRERERATATVLSSSNSGRRVARSHSPYRKSQYKWELEEQPRSNKEESTLTLSSNSGASLSSTSSSSSKGSRRWSLKDFLLFRSASEGRGSSKDPLKKYSVAAYKKSDEVKASSFRSSDGPRRKGGVSAHELHYAMKKAESQDMKKRTFLPYKQGILGRLSGFGL
ncbi:hypothetical protein SESBI_32212 [Sesbania bispinosa]|nr:hypothetical protein SESBI_32212 [Sesbania bispinosa]